MTEHEIVQGIAHFIGARECIGNPMSKDEMFTYGAGLVPLMKAVVVAELPKDWREQEHANAVRLMEMCKERNES